MEYLTENGKVHNWKNKPEIDLTWNEIDIKRMKTYEMRFLRLGIEEEERNNYVYIAVMKKKHSGLIYSDEIEKKLKTLIIE